MKIVNSISYMVIGACMIFTLLAGYWQLYPYNVEKIYDQYNLPILNTDHVVYGGETIRWRAHFIMHMASKIEYRYIIESPNNPDCEYKILYEGAGVSKIGEVDHTSAMVVVPINFKPCVYHVRIETNLHPNPSGRIITITAVTENFTVK